MYDGDSNKIENRIGLYCGDLIPPNLISKTNYIFLHFESHSEGGTRKGFKLEYHQYGKLCKNIQYNHNRD